MEDFTKPVLPGTAESDYERYLRTEELLRLQKTATEAVHHDELLFQVTHQSSELWLKLACADLELATGHIGRDEIAPAVRLTRRATQSILLITTQIHMLEHMSPWEYQTIRRVLGHGSGFDSPGFKQVHRLSPLLADAFTTLLERRHLTIVALYQNGRQLEDLYQLAEQLIEWDERVVLWKFHHLKLVERIIGGHVIGTQGTPVEVLGKRIGVMYFPELWEARNRLTALAKEQEGQK